MRDCIRPPRFERARGVITKNKVRWPSKASSANEIDNPRPNYHAMIYNNFHKSIHDAAMHHFMFTWSQIKPPWRHPGLNTQNFNNKCLPAASQLVFCCSAVFPTCFCESETPHLENYTILRKYFTRSTGKSNAIHHLQKITLLPTWRGNNHSGSLSKIGTTAIVPLVCIAEL